MTPPKKPDWMEIADGDYQVPEKISKKRRPLLFAMTALLVITGGVVVAQTHEEFPASAEELVTPQSSQSATQVTPAINPSQPANPAISSPPSMKGGDDDEFGEHEGRKRGEHDDRGERDDFDDFEEH